QLRVPTLPIHLLSSSTRSPISLTLASILILASLNTFFGLINSWCSALQLVLAFTQTAAN
ncbi:unnamed protein product, partial [Hymenolepis diminuta]